jgi:hypothetical protein
MVRASVPIVYLPSICRIIRWELNGQGLCYGPLFPFFTYRPYVELSDANLMVRASVPILYLPSICRIIRWELNGTGLCSYSLLTVHM